MKDGKIVKLEVMPASRRKDVEIIGPVAPLPTPVSQGGKATASSVYHKSPGYEADKAFDGDPATRWSMEGGQGTGWLEVDIGKPMPVSRIVIVEESYPQTAAFAFEAQATDGSWMKLANGKSIGAYRELKIAPVTAQRFRLRILESKLVNPGAGATIDELQLFTY